MKSETEEFLIKHNKYILIIIGIILIGITIYAVSGQEMVTAQITKSQAGLLNGSWINLSNPVNATSGILEFEIRPETWTKKRALHIDNTAGSESNYTSVNLTVPYINGMNNDFSDLRFYNDTDGTIQPYWIESKVNGSWAKVWINISHLNADSWTNDTYYMYYSNPVATFNNTLGAEQTFIREIDSGQPVKGAWTLDGNAQDTSGNANHGTLYGGMGYITGKFGQAGQFDGSDDYVNVGNNVSLSPAVVSYGAWFNDTGGRTGTYPALVKSSSYTMEFYGSSLNSWIKIGGTWRLIGSVTVTTGQWHYALTTFDGTNASFYYDGALVTSTDAYPGSVSSASYVNIGRDPSNIGRLFSGSIDEVRIYNRALTQAEITDLYNNYGYTTTSYPGRELVRKYASPEPSIIISDEEIEFFF